MLDLTAWRWVSVRSCLCDAMRSARGAAEFWRAGYGREELPDEGLRKGAGSDVALGLAEPFGTGSGEFSSLSATRGLSRESPITEACTGRSPLLGISPALLAGMAASTVPGAAGDGGEVASDGLSALLALEVPKSGGTSSGNPGAEDVDLAHGRSQPNMGRPAHSRGVAEVGDGGRPDNGRSLHAQTEKGSAETITNMAELLALASDGVRRDGLLCHSDCDVWSAVGICGC